MQRTVPLARGRTTRYFLERTWPRQVTALAIDSLRPFTGSVRNTAEVSLTTYFTMRGHPYEVLVLVCVPIRHRLACRS